MNKVLATTSSVPGRDPPPIDATRRDVCLLTGRKKKVHFKCMYAPSPPSMAQQRNRRFCSTFLSREKANFTFGRDGRRARPVHYDRPAASAEYHMRWPSARRP
eukprot:1092498_1